MTKNQRIRLESGANIAIYLLSAAVGILVMRRDIKRIIKTYDK